MEIIHPINKKTIEPYIGQPICAVLQDGSYFIGKVSGIRGGMLHFGETRLKPSPKKKSSRKSMNTSAPSMNPMEGPQQQPYSIPLDFLVSVYSVPYFSPPI